MAWGPGFESGASRSRTETPVVSFCIPAVPSVSSCTHDSLKPLVDRGRYLHPTVSSGSGSGTERDQDSCNRFRERQVASFEGYALDVTRVKIAVGSRQGIANLGELVGHKQR